MNRLMFFAVLLFQSTVVFGQSTAALLGSPQTQGKVSMGQSPLGQAPLGQSPFDFGIGQPGQTLTGPLFKSFDCQGSNTAQNQANARVDFNHIFNAPCAETKTDIDFLARNENAFAWSPLVVQPHFKSEPIPTQWPNAKTEQIPTQWQNLKLQPIGGRSSGLVPAHDSAK
jgi:hypothetical protein